MENVIERFCNNICNKKMDCRTCSLYPKKINWYDKLEVNYIVKIKTIKELTEDEEILETIFNKFYLFNPKDGKIYASIERAIIDCLGGKLVKISKISDNNKNKQTATYYYINGTPLVSVNTRSNYAITDNYILFHKWNYWMFSEYYGSEKDILNICNRCIFSECDKCPFKIYQKK